MNQVQVKIVGTKFSERFIQRRLHILRRMERIPQFGGKPNIFARDTAIFYGLPYFSFVLEKNMFQLPQVLWNALNYALTRTP